MEMQAVQVVGDSSPGVDFVDHKVIRLAHSRLQLAYARAPTIKPEETGYAVDVAVGAIVRYENYAAEVANDPTLSDIGRQNKMAPERKRVIVDVGRMGAAVENAATLYADMDRDLFAVPQLADSDAVGASRDREIRDVIRGMSADQRSAMLRSLTDGKHDHVLKALMRSPMDLGIPEAAAKAVWRQHVAVTRPAEVADLQGCQASVPWARAILSRIAKVLIEHGKATPGEILNTLYDANLSGIGAWRPYGIDDTSWNGFVRLKGKAA